MDTTGEGRRADLSDLRVHVALVISNSHANIHTSLLVSIATCFIACASASLVFYIYRQGSEFG